MTTLEEKLGYTFQNPALLENALTHSSCANESRGKLQSNERLEFLGDSILGMVVADHLYRNHPDLPEGELTRTRAALVCEESLVEVAAELHLGEYLRLGKGEESGGGGPRPRQALFRGGGPERNSRGGRQGTQQKRGRADGGESRHCETGRLRPSAVPADKRRNAVLHLVLLLTFLLRKVREQEAIIREAH